MLIFEDKLRGTKEPYAAIDEAIRIVQFIRNKALRLWMDTRGTNGYDLNVACSQLAKAFPFASKLNSQARQAAAERAWAAISRFYANCKTHKPGKKGYPRFQHDNRSVEYKQTGWKLEPDGKHITFTDGCNIGRLRLVGSKNQRIDESFLSSKLSVFALLNAQMAPMLSSLLMQKDGLNMFLLAKMPVSTWV